MREALPRHHAPAPDHSHHRARLQVVEREQVGEIARRHRRAELNRPPDEEIHVPLLGDVQRAVIVGAKLKKRRGERRDQLYQRLDVFRDGASTCVPFTIFSRPSATLVVSWQSRTPQARYAFSRLPDSSGECPSICPSRYAAREPIE